MKQGLPDWAQDLPTPTLVYRMEKLQQSAGQFAALCDDYDVTCCYAVKANRHPMVLALLSELGMGFDVASSAELKALADLASQVIVSTGPGLSGELMSAVNEWSGVAFFDNSEQINVARECGLDVRDHGLRLAIPGDYAAFGFEGSEIRDLLARGLKARKLNVHAGEYFDKEIVERRLQYVRSVVGDLDIDLLDVGGGFGVLSNDSARLEDALATLKRFSQNMGAQLVIEPGKAIVARCGYLVTTVLARKERANGQVLIVDSSSYNLGQMEIRRLSTASRVGAPSRPTTVIGPTCYEGDIWGRFELPALEPGDRLVFSNMGAYTMSIASSLHGLPGPEEVFVD